MSQQGTRIGPYALQVQVGRAASCGLWHALRADGKARGPAKVAVRLLDDPGDNQAQARLELEYQRLKALDGAGAPQVVAHYAGFGALVMEQRLGSTLRALLDASIAATLDLDRATALEIALGTARILRHAHQLPEGLVHGRLSPADILLGRDGTVTLMGWGGWSPQVWSQGVCPELMRGQAPSPAADIYALGAVLTTMFEPRLALDEGLQAAGHRVIHAWPAAGRLLEDLLRVNPGARPADLGLVIHELLSLGRHHGGVARIGELAERCGSFRRGGASARAMMGAGQAPVAPVAPAAPTLPPINPPPVVPPVAAEPPPQPPVQPVVAPTQPPQAADAIPRPVAPEAEPAAPEPAAQPDPPAEPEPPAPEPEDAIEKTELIPPEPAPPSPDASDLYDEEEEEDREDASMQLMERVALAMVGLLAMALLAWLGRACIGG